MIAELLRVAEHHFPATDTCDVCFDIAMLCQLLGRPEEALRLYERSTRFFGESPATLHNMGVCYYQLDRNRAALDMFDSVLKLDAHHAQAARFRERVSALLEAVPARAPCWA